MKKQTTREYQYILIENSPKRLFIELKIWVTLFVKMNNLIAEAYLKNKSVTQNETLNFSEN